MSVRILILIGIGDGLQIADELTRHTNCQVFIFLDKRSRLKTNFNIAGEVSSLKKEDFLLRFLRKNRIEAIVDASHPFDKDTTKICVKTAKLENIKFRKFTRPSWKPRSNDNWITLPTLNEAEKIIPNGSNVFIATGRNGLEKFSKLTSCKFFIRRLGDRIGQCSLKNGEFIYGDPPFSIKDEISLFESLNIDVLVIKNVGGKGSFAKVEAARALNILVLMIDKPQKSNTLVISSIPEIFKWVDTNL